MEHIFCCKDDICPTGDGPKYFQSCACHNVMLASANSCGSELQTSGFAFSPTKHRRSSHPKRSQIPNIYSSL